MAKKIMIVDDEETLCEALRFNLELEGYQVAVAHSGEEALSSDIGSCDLVLLDVMMGGMSGFRLAQLLKDNPSTARIPIIFCTAKDREDDMMAGFHLGADDYIAKPFSIRNVLARVAAVLRRTADEPAQTGLDYEGIHVDTALKQVFVDGEEQKMPRKEYEMLLLFLTNRGRVFSREEILNRVWQQGVVVTDRTVDVNITRLRQKLGAYGSHIITRSGYGYGFVE